jgi:hypothetical protein
MADNQNNLKGLKFLVIFMGVLIIAGVITIISTIIYRLNDDTLLTSDNSDIDIVTDINLADNAEIQSITSNYETITIYYAINGADFVEIFSIKDGKNIKKFKLK